jgi:hypothetical protein
MTHSTLAVFGLGGGELLLILVALFVIGGLLVVGLVVTAYFLTRSLKKKPNGSPGAQGDQPEASIQCGKQVAEHANLAGSQFHDVNLASADFDNVNLTNTRFNNVNLSNVTITAAHLGGAVFKHVGPPPDKDGKQERQRPVRFEEMMLCDSTFRKVDLSNVRITDCDLTGMTINGILVTELITAHEKQL